ncbi:histidine kinase [Oryzomonas japonica]|uniref:histidine kinase n=1 Tax=Oryzomonas japonica TaxID=2603858 RepID=A0A7J4ZNL9_9BACT|nr:ATP-binding protein [Oryzomonas japonica]KAB0664418.1 histidine kinase [Oryzomonas japonica]
MDGGPAPMNASLRRQLSGWIALVTIISGIAAGGCSFFLAFREAQELQDDQLQQVALLVGRSDKTVEPWAGITKAEERHDPDARIIIIPLGTPIPAGQTTQITRPVIPPDLPEGLQTIDSQGETWRLFVRTLPSGLRIAVGQPTAVRNETARGSGLRTLVPVLLLVPFLSLLTAWLVRRSLAPVASLSRQLDQRDDTNLTTLPEGGVPKEIRPFVTSINGLMQRLDDTLAQQRRFIADAAHELRSPLTALTLQAENLERSDQPQERGERLRHLKEGLARTRSLLDQLLSLARQQSSAVPAVEFRLDRLVQQVLEDVMPMAAAKGIDLGCERLEEVVVNAPADALAILMRNAVDNAVRYTPAGGIVDVELYREEGRVVFQVADNGRGIPSGEEERIFEPFYRVIGTDETGSGLGLAIVRSIADRLGGTVSLRNREGVAGALFRYLYPPG